jgi:hypothetical protein
MAATPTGIAGREKTDTSLQNMPFSLTGEGHFFCMYVFVQKGHKIYNYQLDIIFSERFLFELAN